jgi:hypothetical protein
MNFVRTREGHLIAVVDIMKFYELEHAGGGRTVMAVVRTDSEPIELARDYSIDRLAKALDPVRR